MGVCVGGGGGGAKGGGGQKPIMLDVLCWVFSKPFRFDLPSPFEEDLHLLKAIRRIGCVVDVSSTQFVHSRSL